MSKKQIRATILYGVFLLFTVLIVLQANFAVPFMMDDEWYRTLLYSEERLKSFSDVVSAQIWHYNNWGGRSMTHTILQFTLMAGEIVADSLNTLVMLLLSYIIMSMGAAIANVKLSLSQKFAWLLAIIGLLHGLNPNWKLSMYWQSGAANYLYITVFILLFMWCYTRELSGNAPKPLKGISIFIIPLAILAGWSNENMGPVAFLIAAATMIVLRRQKKPIRIWMWEGAGLSLLGSALCILAPGNFVRSAHEDNGFSLSRTLFVRFYQESNAYMRYLFGGIFVTLFVVFVARGIYKIKLETAEWFYLAGALLSWGAMILSPHYPDRASFGTLALLYVVVASSVNKILKEHRELTAWFVAGGALIWLRGILYLIELFGIDFGLIS